MRFKPILLTALAAMIGAATILLDPIFQGLAISLLFGLASSTLLTVLVIPAIYIALRAAAGAAIIRQIEEPPMEKNYSDITKRISGDLRKLRKDIPDTMKAFSALAQAATRDGALDRKTKELIALAIGIATRCDGCIGFHTEALVRLGATRQEVEETLGMAVYMGGGPSLMYAADAISAFEQFEKQLKRRGLNGASRR